MILVKCTILENPKELKKVFENNEIIGKAGDDEYRPILAKVLGFKKKVHSSAILKKYRPYDDSGIIFETNQEPDAIVPFDLYFIRALENYVDIQDVIDSGLFSEILKYKFDNVKAMGSRFNSSIKAQKQIDELYKEYSSLGGMLPALNKLTDIFEFKADGSIKENTDSYFEHNEVLFKNKLADIHPLAFFGEENVVKKHLAKAKISSDLDIYPTAEAYFKEKKVVYK